MDVKNYRLSWPNDPGHQIDREITHTRSDPTEHLRNDDHPYQNLNRSISPVNTGSETLNYQMSATASTSSSKVIGEYDTTALQRNALQQTETNSAAPDTLINSLNLDSLRFLMNTINTHKDEHQQREQIKEPTSNVFIDTPIQPAPTTIHTHGKVSLNTYCGIQAKNNNCAIASTLMAFSHSKLLNIIIKRIEDEITEQTDNSEKDNIASLSELLKTLKNFNFNMKSNPYIADDKLNILRGYVKGEGGSIGSELDPVDLIQSILELIYDKQCTKKESTEISPNHSNPIESLKHKISLIHLTCNEQLHHNRKESSDRPDKIEGVNIPENLIPGGELIIEHPSINEINNRVRAYYTDTEKTKRTILLTEHIDKKSSDPLRQTYTFLNPDQTNKKTTELELEKHCTTGKSFIRKKTCKFANIHKEEMTCIQKITGHNADSPDKGELEITVYKKARNIQDLIDIWIDQMKESHAMDEKTAKQQLLPDNVHHPEALILTIPNFGIKVRANIDWTTGADIPTAIPGEKISYEVSAVISIELSHYVAWMLEKGLIHYADSMGDVEDDNTVPIIVTAPFPESENALQAANEASEGVHASYVETMRRLANLRNSAALIILNKKDASQVQDAACGYSGTEHSQGASNVTHKTGQRIDA